MKKTFIPALAMAALLLTACGGDDSVPADATVSETTTAATTGTKEDITAADITAAVTAWVEIPSAVEKTADNIGAFYDVDTSTVTDMSVLICGSGAYPDELAVFKFTDSASAAAGAEAVQKRLDSQTELYRDYTPDEMYKLEDAFIITKDNWVAMAVCSDNAKAKEIIESFL